MFEFAKRSATILIIAGVVAVIFGVVTLSWPVPTMLTLVLVWAWYAIIDGSFELIAASRPENRPARNLLLLTGISGVVAGLFVVFRPFEASLTLTWILGIWLVIRGASSLFSAFSSTLNSPLWLLILGAILFIVAGIIFMTNPGSAVLAMSQVLGLLAICWGLFTLGGGLAMRRQVRESKATAKASA